MKEVEIPYEGENNEILYDRLPDLRQARLEDLERRVDEMEKMLAVFNKNWRDYQEMIEQKFQHIGGLVKPRHEESGEVDALRDMLHRIESQNSVMRSELEFKMPRVEEDDHSGLRNDILKLEGKVVRLEKKLEELERWEKGFKVNVDNTVRPVVIE
ncbi:hypothetical protein A3K63_01835 [Candidatus Micrarchaeota archaeon RBG_16_49_10]|nr:MAG: hypothetical protein A3K63_01835 [Candidatus Micrarchaeota archaeon RBG_16_49_10]